MSLVGKVRAAFRGPDAQIWEVRFRWDHLIIGRQIVRTDSRGPVGLTIRLEPQPDVLEPIADRAWLIEAVQGGFLFSQSTLFQIEYRRIK